METEACKASKLQMLGADGRAASRGPPPLALEAFLILQHDSLCTLASPLMQEDEEEPAAGSRFPPGSFRPRRVVWAKVEGHDWWPARVVRRRAVPREVGPPPGGPSEVCSFPTAPSADPRQLSNCGARTAADLNALG